MSLHQRRLKGGAVAGSENKNQRKYPKVYQSAKLLHRALFHLLLSRCVLIVVQFAGNFFIPDLPTDAFKFTGLERANLTSLDRSLGRFLEGLIRWDSVHFQNIALNGYIFENTLAFYPLFPGILSKLGEFTSWFLPIHQSTGVVFSGVFFNNVIFVATGLILFDFVKRVYGSEARAFWASFLYAWNPASIFFSSLYTESLYAFLTFTGLWILYGFGFQRLRILSALISFCFLLLSCGLRSNGLANFGYLAFFLLFTGNRNLFLEFKRSFGHIFKILKRLLFNGFILLVLLGITVCATTLVGNEVARRFCETKNPHSPEAIAFAEEHDYVLQGNVGELEWCGRIGDFKPSLFPPFYGHIQKKYWSVEFLGYWKLRKLPCFLLAAPVVLIYVLVSTKGFEGRLRASSSLWRGLLNVAFSTDPFLPMFAHNTIMVLAGLTIFNVEILTRMLFSASPLLYVGLAEIVSNYLKSKASDWTELNWRSWRRSGRLMALLYAYFAVYFVGGTVLHSNWGPFT